jgi:hypothetical protein
LNKNLVRKFENIFKKYLPDAISKPFIPRLNMRSMMRFIYDIADRDLVGCEIGLNMGLNALNIMNTLPIKKLYLIDPYCEDERYGNSEIRKELALNRLKPFEDRCVFLEMESESACKLVEGELDFVYIDGCHNYEYVKKDIDLYYPKVRAGGVVGGHDFSPAHFGVCKAVINFIEKNDLKILFGRDTDWWIVKS